MTKLTTLSYFKSFIATLVLLTFAFIIVLAAVDPVCTHCTMVIAQRAMLGAQYLTGAWFLAGIAYCWDYRNAITVKLKAFWSLLKSAASTNKSIKT